MFSVHEVVEDDDSEEGIGLGLRTIRNTVFCTNPLYRASTSPKWIDPTAEYPIYVHELDHLPAMNLRHLSQAFDAMLVSAVGPFESVRRFFQPEIPTIIFEANDLERRGIRRNTHSHLSKKGTQQTRQKNPQQKHRGLTAAFSYRCLT